MWLLPAISHIATLAARVYYDLQIAGREVPKRGPVLLVGNHPNALFDPALLAVVAQRPVRFLAKAPLFNEPGIGWFIRALGPIPVYRPSDDPSLVGKNDESFRAAHTALADGSVVGIFPEGISHSGPSLIPFKTGAARLALGAAEMIGGTFPIIPVGLSYRAKHRFRSEALVVIGEPVEWEDLLVNGQPVDGNAIRELTARTFAALREVTVNLERWEDAPLVESAAMIYAAEFGRGKDPLERVQYMRAVTDALTQLRNRGGGEWERVAQEVAEHARLLESLGLHPTDLKTVPSFATATRWTLRQLAFLLPAGALALIGTAVFFVPYRLTRTIVARIDPSDDSLSTYYTFGGALLFTVWIALLSLLATVLLGWKAGLAALIVLPALALLTVVARDRWRYARQNARRFLLFRRRVNLHRILGNQQQEIATRLRDLREQIHA